TSGDAAQAEAAVDLSTAERSRAFPRILQWRIRAAENRRSRGMPHAQRSRHLGRSRRGCSHYRAVAGSRRLPGTLETSPGQEGRVSLKRIPAARGRLDGYLTGGARWIRAKSRPSKMAFKRSGVRLPLAPPAFTAGEGCPS